LLNVALLGGVYFLLKHRSRYSHALSLFRYIL
jgi:hypothetical protein